MRLGLSGEWPGEVTIRSSYSKATCRSWNLATPYGHLRLLRGGSAFLKAAADHVLSYGVQLVASPPLLHGADEPWEKAGFKPFLTLDLYRRNIVTHLPDHDPLVDDKTPDFDKLCSIDHAAFDHLWQMDPVGLQESFRATTSAGVLTVSSEEGVCAYAIVGVSSITGYLQRIAVDPIHQAQGHGRRLLRASMRWAAHHGAATMMLNTQPDNDASAALYTSEGFVRLPDGLRVLQYESA